MDFDLFYTLIAMSSIGKILFVHQGFELYGSDRVLLLNIRAAKEKYPEMEIVVVLPRNGSLAKTLGTELGVKVIIKKLGVIRKYDLKRFNFSAVFQILTFFRLIKFLNSFKLVYINSMVIVDYMLAVRFIEKNKFIHVHELPVGFSRFFFSKLLYYSKSRLIFISNASRNSFPALKNRTQQILWNGCRAITDGKILLKDMYPINLLLIGRINSWKGQPLLINAIGSLAFTLRNRVRLRIVGDVFLKQKNLISDLEKLIQTNDLREIVELLPFTDNPEVHYKWADVVIVPSLLPEPFGLVAIEAMSAGKLVIAARHGGLTEIITDNVTGLLFNPGDSDDLANKITDVLLNPEVIADFGKRARLAYESSFTEEIYIKNLIEII